MSLFSRPLKTILTLFLPLSLIPAHGQVVINEISSASTERVLQWTADGTPRLGSGLPWNAPGFPQVGWSSGNLPAGYGSTVSTNLQTAMQNKTPSLYLRKTFTVTPTQAALTTPLTLQVEADDGFVAYINGVEVTRQNCGPAKHYMYAAQPAYNAATTTGVIEYTLGPANTLLVGGTNTLAIEARNYDAATNFRINAGLKVVTSTTPIALTKAFFDNDNANGSTRTHTNTSGVPSNTSSGTPPAGGWLANAANPTSDNLWTSLQIVTAEQVGAGLGGTGGIRYTITQSGTNRAVSLHAPQISMSGAWSPGGITTAALTSTTLKFRYRTTGDLQFGFRADPALDLSTSSLDGFTVVGLPFGGAAAYEFAAASGGFYGASIDATGAQTTLIGGSINIGNYEYYVGAGCRSGQAVLRENGTAGAGPGGSTGFLAWTYDTFPTTIDSLGFGVKGLTISQWTAGSITVADFQRSRLSFRWKMPAGRAQSFYLEAPSSGTAAERINLGTLVGTGNWESFAVQLSDASQSAALITKLNNSFSKVTKLTGYYAGTPFNNGEAVQLDSINLYYEPTGTTLDENIPNTFGGATGGAITRTVTAGGSASNSTTGTLVNNITLATDPGLTSFQFRLTEDNTASAGNGSSTGFLRCEVTTAAATGAPWSFSLPGLSVRNWTTGAITVAQLSDVTLQFAAKVPTGVTFTVYAEPLGGSTANRANLGTLTGNGTWQVSTREFATASNVEALRAALNAAGTTAFQLTFVGPSNATVGDQLSIDDVQVSPWRAYQVTLNQGTVANQQRFLDYANNLASVNFIPTFVKTTPAPAGGATFAIDNFEVSYNGQDPNATQSIISTGSPGGAWNYFVGLAEPSGGLFDPNLLTPFTPPVGQEGEYDDPQSFRDWVELKNLDAFPVNLAGWTLTDDASIPAKWTFPTNGSIIPANGFLLVMCDGRNAANGTATYLHSNFSLSSASGGYVALANSIGQLQSTVTGIPSQDTFHSWGRNPSGASTSGFLETATPGAENIGIFLSSRVKTPDFYKANGTTSFSGGFYTGTQTLVISTTTSGATIRYTTDGSDPTDTTGTLYSGPITLTPPSDQKSAIVIRARAFKSGLVTSNDKTNSYLLNTHANLKGVPALLFSGDASRNFFLPYGIMAINGGTYPGGLWAANGPSSYNIPIGRGDAFERAIRAELYYPDGKSGWREDVGIRISSSPYSRPRLLLTTTNTSPWTSDHTQKPSFNLYWRGDYGNSTVKDPYLIPGNEVNDYSRLRVRAGKNDILNPFLIDEVGRRLYHDMGWVEPTGTINTAYFNGSFKGFYNMTERLRNETFQLHYRTSNDFDVRYIGEQVDGDANFWNSMQTALNTLNTSPTLSNYQAVQNYLDPVNVADVFLFWIYINMDDWPGNNWAAQRERTPNGRYRMVVWDVEAAFGRFGKAVTYDTINNNLLNSSTECGDIFKRLYKSPEFKLLVADRINKHLWNGGVLDDRGSTDHFQLLVDQFSALVQPLLTYVANQTIDLSWYNNHINPTTGRRAYLFSSTTGNFRSAGLWPTTEPPTYSQFGGVVSNGYQLVISKTAPAGSTIYYTLNGNDPRLAGGSLAAGATVYSGPVTLNNLVTVKSRVLSAGGEWSGLTEAYFAPAAVPPTPSNLVVAELMYNPPAPSAAEISAGFIDSDDFEFVRLTNVGTSPIDLRDVRWTVGITFDFSLGSVLAINPGTSVLVVRKKLGFQLRYGSSYDALIAGEYGGSLDNNGETLTLATVGASPATIASFTYGTSTPWPKAPDGNGPSLLLINPASAPNPVLASNWTFSTQPGGMPGGVPRTLTYNTWKQLSFNSTEAANAAVSGPAADSDSDGLTNGAEYVLGGLAKMPDRAALEPIVTIENVAGQNYVTLQYSLQAGASEGTATPEVSGDLVTWSTGGANIVTVSGPTNNPNGSVSWKVRDAVPTTSLATRFIRLRLGTP